MAALVSRHTVSRQFEYSYIHVRPRDPSNQRYALFLHGWPSSAHEWHHQIEHFSELGFGVIAPDCLGYGGTSCPAEVEHYRMKAIAQDIIEILDHENIEQVHGIGHDFGCFLLGRLGVYFPERFVTFSFLGLSYRPPGAFFDVDAVNRMTADRFGYSLFGYMKWFNEAPDVGKLLDKHHESIESLIYAADPELWKTHLGPVGALEEWLKSGSRTKVAAYLTESDRSIRAKAFANDSGYGPTLNWYKAHVRNINYPDEKDISEEKKILHQPILLITFARDFIGIPEMQAPTMTGYAPNLVVKMLDTAHWVQLEAPDEVNALLQSHILSV